MSGGNDQDDAPSQCDMCSLYIPFILYIMSTSIGIADWKQFCFYSKQKKKEKTFSVWQIKSETKKTYIKKKHRANLGFTANMATW